jgi:uncharacterized protein
MPDQPGAPLLGALGLAVFLAGITNGTVGLGYAQVAAAAFALLVDPKTAVVLLSITVPVSAGGQILKQRRHGFNLARIGSLFVGGMAGVPLGVLLLTVAPSQLLALMLGIFTILFVLSSLRRVPLRVTPSQERLLSPLMGVTAGICNGAAGVSGPVLASYLLALDIPATTFALTISTMFTVMGLLRLVSLVVTGAITPLLWLVGLGLIPPMMLGQQVGFWLQGKVSRETFRRGVLAVLFVAGLGLLRRAFEA